MTNDELLAKMWEAGFHLYDPLRFQKLAALIEAPLKAQLAQEQADCFAEISQMSQHVVDVEAERDALRAKLDAMTKAAQDVLAERKRQQDIGWTIEHDNTHNPSELARAASCYATNHAYPGRTQCH